MFFKSHDQMLFSPPPPHTFFGTSSAFEVAMWKSLATNPNQYNNRAISSLSAVLCCFLFFPLVAGVVQYSVRAGLGEGRVLLFPFPDFFYLQICMYFIGGFFSPPFSLSFMRWWFCFPSRPMMKPQESPGPCDESTTVAW